MLDNQCLVMRPTAAWNFACAVEWYVCQSTFNNDQVRHQDPMTVKTARQLPTGSIYCRGSGRKGASSKSCADLIHNLSFRRFAKFLLSTATSLGNQWRITGRCSGASCFSTKKVCNSFTARSRPSIPMSSDLPRSSSSRVGPNSSQCCSALTLAHPGRKEDNPERAARGMREDE